MSVLKKFKPIDTHNHVEFKAGTESLDIDGAKAILRESDYFGIDRLFISAPITSLDLPHELVKKRNDIVIEAMKLSDRFIGLCFVNPGYVEEAQEEIERCVVQGGMQGIKMYHHYYMDDPVQFPLAKRAGELGIPILMHAGKLVDKEMLARPGCTSNSSHFLNIAKKFPETNFIHAHVGCGEWEWSLRMLENQKNVYVDISGTCNDSLFVKRTIEILGEERVLFGTDLVFEEGVGKVLDADLSDSVMQKILHDNAQGLLDGRSV